MQSKTRNLLCSAALIAGTAVMMAYLNGALAQDNAAGNRQLSPNATLEVKPVPGQRFFNNFAEQQVQGPNPQRTHELLSQYNQTEDEAERAKIVKELTAVAAEEFDARQESREKQLQQLEEQLKKLRSVHARRAKEKDEIVRDRVRQLLRDADGLGWGSDGGADPVIAVPRTSAVPALPAGVAPVTRFPGQPAAPGPGGPRPQ
jgi:TolA-binding protein